MKHSPNLRNSLLHPEEQVTHLQDLKVTTKERPCASNTNVNVAHARSLGYQANCIHEKQNINFVMSLTEIKVVFLTKPSQKRTEAK